MRRVAAALDTGAASLYVYVSGREGLLQAMLDRVTATVELEAPDPSRWRAQLHSLLRRLHQALVAHPGIAAMTLADPPTTEAVLRLTENLLGILLAGGIDPQDAAWACDIFVLLVTGVASEDDVRRPRSRSDDDRRDQVVRAIRSTSSTKPSPAYRPTGSLFSPPTPRRWSPAMATSGFATPSTLLSTAWSPERPGSNPNSGGSPLMGASRGDVITMADANLWPASFGRPRSGSRQGHGCSSASRSRAASAASGIGRPACSTRRRPLGCPQPGY